MKKYQDVILEAKDLYKEGKVAESALKYEEAFQIEIDANDLIDLGMIYLELFNYQKAKECFSSVVKVIEVFPRAYYALGLVEEELDNKQQALEYYEKALSQNEDYIEANMAVSYLSEEMGDEEKAIRHYKQILANHPNHFWANVNVSSVFEKMNEDEAALAYALKAYEINPNEKMVSYNLGVIYTKLGFYDNAKKSYLEELEKKEPFFSTYINLGLLLKDAFKDYNQAIYYYTKGLQVNKDDINLWYNLGCLYVVMGKIEDAKNCFLYALVKNPKVKESIEKDSELQDFIKTKDYQDLLEKTQK